MMFKRFIPLALTLILPLTNGLVIPTGDEVLALPEPIAVRDAVPGTSANLLRRGHYVEVFGFEFALQCPITGTNKVNAAECWRRFFTACTSNGEIINPYLGRPNICNVSVCYCVRDEDVTFPTFLNPSTQKPAVNPYEVWMAAQSGAGGLKTVRDAETSTELAAEST